MQASQTEVPKMQALLEDTRLGRWEWTTSGSPKMRKTSKDLETISSMVLSCKNPQISVVFSGEVCVDQEEKVAASRAKAEASSLAAVTDPA